MLFVAFLQQCCVNLIPDYSFALNVLLMCNRNRLPHCPPPLYQELQPIAPQMGPTPALINAPADQGGSICPDLLPSADFFLSYPLRLPLWPCLSELWRPPPSPLCPPPGAPARATAAAPSLATEVTVWGVPGRATPSAAPTGAWVAAVLPWALGGLRWSAALQLEERGREEAEWSLATWASGGAWATTWWPPSRRWLWTRACWLPWTWRLTPPSRRSGPRRRSRSRPWTTALPPSSTRSVGSGEKWCEVQNLMFKGEKKIGMKGLISHWRASSKHHNPVDPHSLEGCFFQAQRRW